MSMELWNYAGHPLATAFWDFHDARAATRAAKTEDYFDESEDEYFKVATEFAANREARAAAKRRLSPYLHPASKVLDLSARVADALDELEFDPEAPNVLDAGLAELDNLIAVLSGTSISVFTSALFDFMKAEAQHEDQEWWGDGLRRRCIVRLARVLDDAFTASGLLGSGYAQRAVEAAHHAALKEYRDEGAFVAAFEEQNRSALSKLSTCSAL